jgi:signal transduction histidine kinase/PAS domain-containing protein
VQDHQSEPEEALGRMDEKETQIHLNHVLNGINGGIAVYEVGRHVRTLMYSDGVAKMLGFTREEYDRLIRDDAMNGVYPLDRENLLSLIGAGIEKHEDVSSSYRVLCKKKIIWVNLTAYYSHQSEQDLPVYNAFYTTASYQFVMYQNLMDESPTCTTVIDPKTFELFYANKAAFDLYRRTPQNYVGQKCYQVFHGMNHPCANCQFSSAVNYEDPAVDFVPTTGKYIRLKFKKTMWIDHPAVAIYGTDITDRVLQEQKVEAEKERYRIVLEKNGIALFDYDFVNGNVYSNETYQKYELSRQDIHKIMNNQADMSVIHPDDIRTIKHFFIDLHEKGGFDQVTLRLKLVTGSYHWVKLGGYVIHNEAGNPIRAIGTIEDVNEQQLEWIHQLEQFTSEYDRNLTSDQDLRCRIIFNLSQHTIADFYAAIPCVRWSGFDKGISMDRFFDEYCQQRVSEDEYLLLKDNLSDFDERCNHGEEICRRVQNRENGKNVWLSIVIHYTRNPYSGDCIAFVSVIDITSEIMERKINRCVVNSGEEFLALVDVGTGQIDYVIRREGIIGEPTARTDYMHEMAAAVSQMMVDEDSDLWIQENSIQTITDHLQKEGHYSTTFATIEHGAIRHKLLNYNWLDGSHTHILFMRTDVTDVFEKEHHQEIELKNALNQARAANKAKTEFLSRMSHDMRTPLNAVIGFSRLASEEHNLPGEAQEYLDRVNSSGEYLLGLINDVLDMTKIEGRNFELHEEPVNGPEFLNSIADIFKHQAARKHITLITDFSRSKTPWVIMDKLRSEQIYSNLLNNAIKYSDEGTVIHWTMVDVPIDEHTMHMTSIIQDEGCGMSKSFMNRIFQPFEQEYNSHSEKEGGTGLGLAIVKSLVELMGGTISVESELGKGSTFTIELNRRTGRPQLDSKIPEHPVYDRSILQNARVLLCEDNQINRELAGVLLKRAGMVVEAVENGELGVEAFEHSEPGYYDAVLMDMRMPVMGGLQATRLMRSLPREDAHSIPIIAMTANAFDEDVKDCLNAGMNAHTAKPIDPEKLYESLAEEIARARKKD